MTHSAPGIDEIAAARRRLGTDIVRTPVVRCAGLEDLIGAGTRIYGKLEFLQRTGTFKARGALVTLRSLSPEQRTAGVTAVSAGNHAIATAFAAKMTGTSARVVMIESANPYRIEACRAYGAEVEMAGDAHEAFERAERIQREEGRYLVHPFEGETVVLGTGTLGLEICEQVDSFDGVIVPVGGGGLIAGVSNAIRQCRPNSTIVGVEPEGADTMQRSFESGQPERIDKVRTIADSLGAPYALPYSFALTRDNVNRIVRVSDDSLSAAMRSLFERMKLAVEPACAAATAALIGPLQSDFAGKTVVLVFCGSNIDWTTWQRLALQDRNAD